MVSKPEPTQIERAIFRVVMLRYGAPVTIYELLNEVNLPNMSSQEKSELLRMSLEALVGRGTLKVCSVHQDPFHTSYELR